MPDTLNLQARLAQLGRTRTARDLLYAPLLADGGRVTPRQVGPRRHVAHCPEVAIVTSGAARVITPSRTFELHPGQLLLIDFGVDHEEAALTSRAEYSIFWCGLAGSLAIIGETQASASGAYLGGPTALLDGFTDLESIASAISAEMRRKDSGWVHCVNGLLRYLSYILLRRARRQAETHGELRESPPVPVPPRVWRTVRAVHRFCEANFRQPIRLRDVARATGYSPAYLSRMFTSYAGRSVSAYLQELRLTAARQLLERTDLSLGEVAARVGYSDHSHFTRAFSRVFGLTPKEYRRRLEGR